MAGARGDNAGIAAGGDASAAGLRLDKWLWFARFFKSRTLAAAYCASGKIRVDRRIVTKVHHVVRVGSVLTFPLHGHVRVVKVKALGVRRGSATLARALYEDLSPPAGQTRAAAPPPAQRDKGAGRPTKLERRAIARLTGRS